MVTSAWEGPTRVVWSLIAKGTPRYIVIGVLVRGLRRRQQCAAVGRIAVYSAFYHGRWGCAASKCLVSAAIRESAPLRRFLHVLDWRHQSWKLADPRKLKPASRRHPETAGGDREEGRARCERPQHDRDGSYKLNPSTQNSYIGACLRTRLQSRRQR